MQCHVDISNALLLKAAEQFATPLYLYSSDVMQQHYLHLKENFNQLVDIFYSLKANPNIAVSANLQKLGAGAEVCSGAELKVALLAGYSPENIIFVGPVKRTVDLITALENRIYAIVCESKEELTLINELAKTRGQIANVAIRVNPVFSVRNASLKMGGVPSQFGIDQEELFQNKKFFLSKTHLHIRGIQVFNSSRILNAKLFVDNIKNILQLAHDLEQIWGLSFSMIDVGGGIGIPYFKYENQFDMTKLKHLIKPLLKLQKNQKRIILESGRYLVANSGVFLSRIENIKISRQIRFLIINGGMNCHLTAASYGSMLKRNFPIKLLAHVYSTEKHPYYIAGPLCTPADLLGRNVELPAAKVGDYIAILASGAYGATASPGLFLGHGYPAEVLLENNNLKLIRERDSIDDVLRKQVRL